MENNDIFRGDNKKLAESIEALLALDAKGALVPHGIGEHARTLLSTAVQRIVSADDRMDALEGLAPHAELALKALNVAVSVYDVELADNARRGLRWIIAALGAPSEKPRPIRFADLPVVDSLDQLSLGHQIELLRDALDHIAKTCHQSRQQSRRIRWIEARANGALEGKPYDAKLLDLPVEVDREIDRMKRRDSHQVARIRVLEALLLKENELLYAIQGDPGAVPSSAIDAMRGEVFTALNEVKP